jgi:hypothetical protein
MSTLSVPTKIYIKTLAFGLHEAINNDCLDEFLELNDLTQIPEIFNINIEQISILGSLALKKNNDGISTLLNMGAVPIHKCNFYYLSKGSTDLGLISKHCPLEIYHLAVDRLPVDNMSTRVLHEIFIDIFEEIEKMDGVDKCKYFLTKLPLDRSIKIINYKLHGNNELLTYANYLYQKSHNTIGFEFLFQYSIKMYTQLDHDYPTTLKDVVDLDEVLHKLYHSYQIEIKEPNVK